MNKHLITFGIVTLLICVGFSGCDESQSEKSKFYGTWEGGISNSTGILTMTFYNNGTIKWIYPMGVVTNYSIIWMNYDITNGKLCFQSKSDDSACYNYKFSDSNTYLELFHIPKTYSYGSYIYGAKQQ